MTFSSHNRLNISHARACALSLSLYHTHTHTHRERERERERERHTHTHTEREREREREIERVNLPFENKGGVIQSTSITLSTTPSNIPFYTMSPCSSDYGLATSKCQLLFFAFQQEVLASSGSSKFSPLFSDITQLSDGTETA